MKAFRVAVLGFAVGVLASGLVSCGQTKTCSASTCNGCCDAMGTCQDGFSSLACGSAGAACATCPAGQSCLGGLCAGGSGGGTGGAGGGFGGGGGGGTGGGGLGGGGGTVLADLDAFCAQAIPAICGYYVRCNYMASQTTCEAFYSAAFASSGGCARDEKAAVKDGRASFDGARLGRCLDSLDTVACALTSSPSPDCDELVTGLVPVGQSCYADLECAGDAFCDEGGTCPGTCQAKVQAGGDAGVGGVCTDGTYYSNGTCLTLVALGGTCTQNYQCAAGLWCNGTTCASPVTRGQSCAAGEKCAASLVCTNDVCGDLVGAGQTCSNSSPRVPCMQDLFCAATGLDGGTCSAFSSVGGACGSTTAYCGYGLFCDSPDGGAGTCATPRTQGQACTTNSECGPDLWCDTAGSGTCQPARADGQPCTSSAQCLGYCNGTTCTASGCHDPTP